MASTSMIYIFTFLGEFGYELLNWQGVVRKFARTLRPGEQVVCCGRRGMAQLYESADLFFEISDLELFRSSVACSYYALASPAYDFTSPVNRLFSRRLRRSIQSRVEARLGTEYSSTREFVFSDEATSLRGCRFGARNSPYDPEHDIYDRMDVGNNLFARIKPVLDGLGEMENRLGFDLGSPFVLCQTRRRDPQVPAGSHDPMSAQRLVAALAERVPVVLLDFATGRQLDSGSSWDSIQGCMRVSCRSFAEQSCLIDKASLCLFFTEGDFGSHIYLPPLFGRDVVAVAPWTVFQLRTSPLEFWNENVFRFGGQIYPLVAEEIDGSAADLEVVVDTLAARAHGR